jgi:hypothetical protein
MTVSSSNPTQTFFKDFDTCAQSLVDSSKGEIEHLSVETVLRLANVVQELGQECDRLYTRIQRAQVKLLESTQDSDRKQAVAKSQKRLLHIIEQCNGKAASVQSIKDLKLAIHCWRHDFFAILKDIEVAVAQEKLKNEYDRLFYRVSILQTHTLQQPIENSQKLELLKRLVAVEDSLEAIAESIQTDANHALRLAQKLAQVQRELEDVEANLTNLQTAKIST